MSYWKSESLYTWDWSF